MNSGIILPIVLMGLLLVFGIIFVIYNKKQEQKNSINSPDSKDGKKDNSNKKTDDKNVIKREDIFKFMEFDKILDNMIVQNNGTRFTMAIKCKGINYDLMSDVEQIAVEEGFITFLNTLRFPIQLYVQAQNVDLKSAIKTYKENISGVKKEYEAVNDEYSKVIDAFDSTKDDLDRIERERAKIQNVYEYASDIIQYVERLSLNKSLLQRNFYVLVSYNSSEIMTSNNFSKEEIVNICYNELLTRAQIIISGLASCSVGGVILDSNELADLIYTAYNRDDKGLLSVKEALDSGFYRLYSTAEDVFVKKQEKLEEEIRNEAKIKAIESIQKAIKDGTYVSPEAEALDTIEQINKQAYEYVEQEQLTDDIKEKAREILVDDYKEQKKEILENIVRKQSEILGTNTNTKNNNNVESINMNSNINNNVKNDVVTNTVKNENIQSKQNVVPNVPKQNTIPSTNQNVANIDINTKIDENTKANNIVTQSEEKGISENHENKSEQNIKLNEELNKESISNENDIKQNRSEKQNDFEFEDKNINSIDDSRLGEYSNSDSNNSSDDFGEDDLIM